MPELRSEDRPGCRSRIADYQSTARAQKCRHCGVLFKNGMIIEVDVKKYAHKGIPESQKASHFRYYNRQHGKELPLEYTLTPEDALAKAGF